MEIIIREENGDNVAMTIGGVSLDRVVKLLLR
jgi:hypothetical protein